MEIRTGKTIKYKVRKKCGRKCTKGHQFPCMSGRICNRLEKKDMLHLCTKGGINKQDRQSNTEVRSRIFVAVEK